ncbi:MAG: hypothetical protein KBT21_11550 [Treponema sp.]|nr:hypothetical protein [Candidatus Treponema merdequi]
MAITSNHLMDTLKTFYAKNGVGNLLFKNSPTLEVLHQEIVAGKTANFSAMYARSAGCGSNYQAVKEAVKRSGRVKEFAVTPANLFAAEVFGTKELLASQELKGAYLPIAELKMFSACEGYRKTIAMALFGDGTGYIADLPAEDADGATISSIANNDEVTIVLPIYATMYIDIGSSLKIKASKTAADDSKNVTWEVTAIDGQKVTIKNISGSTFTVSGTPVITLAGAISPTGDKLIPTGLAGWLPATVSSGENFFGVDRSIARERLAGTRITATASEKKYKTIQRAIAAIRRYGSKCDMIIMNDEDYLAMQEEIEEKTTFMKVDGGKGRTKAEVGYDSFGFSVVKNYLDNIIPDQYCPKGTFYVLDSSVVEVWAFNNAKKVATDGIGVEPGKPTVASSDADKATRPHQLLVDEIFSVEDGEATEDGPASIVSISTYLNFVITNPSVCASGTFAA